MQQAVTSELAPPGETFSDKLDRVLTHKIWGTLIFIGIMTLMFQSIFTFAHLPMDALQAMVNWLGGAIGKLIPPGDLNSLLVNGVVAGVGAVIVFLPQILLLFLFIGFLEDTGYMAAGGVFDGPADEQDRAARQKFHSDAEFVRLRHSRHHGHAHD